MSRWKRKVINFFKYLVNQKSFYLMENNTLCYKNRVLVSVYIIDDVGNKNLYTNEKIINNIIKE